MAKSGNKSGKIPKKIGGIKLSKGVRKSGEALIAKAQTPEGRRAIAATFAMASAAVARVKAAAPTPPAPPVPPEPPVAAQSSEGVPSVNAAPDGMGTPAIDPQSIAEAVGKAATAFIDGFFGRRR